MVYVKSNSSTSAWGRLHYIFDDAAHDGSKQRVLATTGGNIRLWGSHGSPYPNQSGYYLNQQFKIVRQRAWNKNKRHQAQHLILSFDEHEFGTDNPDDLQSEAKQINELVDSFMKLHFPDCQWISAIQCDGEGHKLHAHVLINSITVKGKCVRTNEFQVDRLRNEWNKHLNTHYFAVTGHVYENQFDKRKPATNTKPKGWQQQLQDTLEWARQMATSIEGYLDLLKDKGVTVTNRNKRGDWSYHASVNGKQKTVRDFYQRRNRKTGIVTTTRGMGATYTPDGLKQYYTKKKKETDLDDNKDNPEANGLQRGGQLAKLAEAERLRRQREFSRFGREEQSSTRDTAGLAGYGKLSETDNGRER